MFRNPNAYRALSIGVVLTRRPGVTKWQKHAWTATSVLPGAGETEWRELRRDGDVVEFHAATMPLELHGSLVEAYVHELNSLVPSVYVVMREGQGTNPFDVVLVTASPYEAQDYCDSGEEIVEKVAMPPMLLAWIKDFVDEFYTEEEFVKRKRDKKRIDLSQDGIGDPRIRKDADFYASPTTLRRRMN